MSSQARNMRTLEVLFVVIATVTAGLLRLFFLKEYPAGFQGDEAWMGLEAQRILAHGWIGVWSPTGWGQPTGPFYWAAFLFSFLPDSVTVLRASTALLGTATIPVFYLFIRSWYGGRAAIIGTVLLAFSYWHTAYSRTAFGLISAPLVECGVLLFLGIGLRERKFWPFLVAGVLSGLGMYTYRGYTFFAILTAALWLVMLILDRPYPFKPLFKHALIFAVAAVLLATPMLVFVATRYNDYMGYGRVVSVFNSPEYKAAAKNGESLSFLRNKLQRAISVYYVGRPPDTTDGMGPFGLLDPLTRVLFTVGVAIGLWRFRRWRYFIIPGGVVVGVLAVAITVPWGENRRGIAALPLVFAAAAVGGDAVFGLFSASLHKLKFRQINLLYAGLAGVIAVAAVAYVATWNSRVYFQKIAPSDATRFAYAYELSRAANYLHSLPPTIGQDPYVYFYSGRWAWDYEARRFQAPNLNGEDRSQNFGKFSLEWTSGHPVVVYLLMPPYDQYSKEIQRRYPGGACVQEKENGKLIYMAYILGSPRASASCT